MHLWIWSRQCLYIIKKFEVSSFKWCMIHFPATNQSRAIKFQRYPIFSIGSHGAPNELNGLVANKFNLLVALWYCTRGPFSQNCRTSHKRVVTAYIRLHDRNDVSCDKKTRHVCETRMPLAATKSNMAKISKSYILRPPHPQGHVMSVKCEEPIEELTVQVWLLYHHPNFKYCTLLVSGTELRTEGQTIWFTRCPRRTFQAGGIKIRSVVNFMVFILCH